jgi:hypothetical protein
MRFAIRCLALLCLQLPGLALAQSPTSQTTVASVCIPPPGAKSCDELHCKGPCKEKWRDGQCLGGYCPKGIVRFSARRGAAVKPTTTLKRSPE